MHCKSNNGSIWKICVVINLSYSAIFLYFRMYLQLKAQDRQNEIHKLITLAISKKGNCLILQRVVVKWGVQNNHLCSHIQRASIWVNYLQVKRLNPKLVWSGVAETELVQHWLSQNHHTHSEIQFTVRSAHHGVKNTTARNLTQKHS